MPCSDHMPSDDYFRGLKDGRSQDASHHPDDEAKIKSQQALVASLEGCLCAIISELESVGMAHQVIEAADQKGRADIARFWYHHVRSDQARISMELNGYSTHEKELIKKLLNGESK